MKKLFTLIVMNLLFCSVIHVQSQTVTIGTLTSYNSGTQFPTSYSRQYAFTRQQILVRGSELISAGVSYLGGTITSLGFDVYDVNNSGPLSSFTIKMKQTSSTAISVFDNIGLTQVYTTSSYYPVSGWNTHTFSTQFTWDGSSNIIIDICYSSTIATISPNASVYINDPGFTSNVLAVDNSTSQCTTSTATTYIYQRPTVRFSITPNLPSCAIISAPANDADSISRTPALTWANGGYATNYDVYFGSNPNPPFVINKTTTSYNPGTLQGNTEYYWQIIAKNPNGNASGCSIWHFNTISGKPFCATNPSPSDNSPNVPYQPTLSWTASTGAAKYRIYFGTSPNPPLIDSTTNTTYNANLATQANQTYYWRVSPKGSYEYRQGCDEWKFTTYSGCVPGLTPVDGSTGMVTYPTLSWSAIPTTIKYYVYLGTSNNPPLYDSTTNTTYDVIDLSPNTLYYWKILSRNVSGFSMGCPVLSFTTKGFNHWFVKTNGNDALSGNCWNNAKQDLSQTMLNAASGDTIHVAAGTYYPMRDTNGSTLPADLRNFTFTLNSGVKIVGGYPVFATGADVQSSLLVQHNPYVNPTILNGDVGIQNDSTDNSYHVVRVRKALQGTALLNGFTITRGIASGSNSLKQDRGAGIYMTYGKLDLFNCIVTRNSTVGSTSVGAGIFNTYGNLKLNTCILNYNKSAGSIGAISVDNGSLSVEYSTVNNNKGTAISTSNSTLYMNNCTVWPNGITDVSINNTTKSQTILNCTIQNLDNNSTILPYVRNSIFGGIDGNVDGHYIYSSYSLIGGTDPYIYSGYSQIYYYLLGLADNGGPTQTCKPDPTDEQNPIIGLGDPSFAGQTDQRGVLRSNPPCMGAYEAPYGKPSDIIINDTIICNGINLTLHVSSNTVSDPIFRWYADSLLTQLLCTGNSYSIPLVNSSKHFYITVHNDTIFANPRTRSKRVSVILLSSAIITQQPVTSNKCVGDSAIFYVNAFGLGITYQWKKNGNDIIGQTNKKLKLFNIQFSDSASYSCLIGCSCGYQIMSDAAKLKISTPLNISAQPQSAVICQNGNTVFDIDANGYGITYQWQKNGINLPGRIHDTLKIYNALLTDAGNYTCVVSCPCGASLTSNTAVLNVHSVSCSISGFSSYYCFTDAPVTLHAFPHGGIFTGSGMTDSTFNPALALVGNNGITYTYTDNYSCVGYSFQTIPVELCVGALPNCAIMQYPPNTATNISRSTSINWTNAGNTASYDVYFGTNSNPPFVVNKTTTSYSPVSTLSANTTYYWKIIAKNSNGSATGCLIWSFKTINSNYAECLSNAAFPTDSGIEVPIKPTLSWPGVPLATKYRVYLGTSPTPPLIDSITITTYQAVNVTRPDKVYYWKIVPKSSAGYVSGCNTWSFRTCSGCTSIIYPSNGSSGISTYPVLSWNVAPNALKYYIYYDTVSNPALVDSTSNTYYSADLVPNAHYYWKIVPRYQSGFAVGCPIQSFTTATTGRHWFVKTNGNDGAAGDCWDNAKRTLSLVMQKALPCDTIHVAAGKYFPVSDTNYNAIVPDYRDFTFTLNPGVRLQGGYPSNASSNNLHTSLLVVRNPKTFETILSGDLGRENDSLDNACHVVFVRRGTGGSCLLDGFTVTKGYAATALSCTTKKSRGAGIYNFGCNLYVRNCMITLNRAVYEFDNSCGGEGGGIYNENGNLIVERSVIQNNQASAYGGGIYCTGGSLKFLSSSGVCTSNYCPDFLTTTGGTSVVINNSTCWDLSASYDISSGGNISITNSTIGNMNLSCTSATKIINCVVGYATGYNFNLAVKRYTFNSTSYYDGTGAMTTSAMPSVWLDVMGYYGGTTPTRRLISTSGSNPAVAIGDPAFAGTTDQRGVVRANPPCIGAYEARYAIASDILINDVTICPGQSIMLTASATTIPNPIFRWYSDANLTNLVYTGPNFTTPVLNASTHYYVTVYGDNIFSNPVSFAKNVTVSVTSALQINQQPTPVNACTGDSASFSVAATGAGLTYQWFKNNHILSGKTNNILIINNISYADTGMYYCRLNNTCSSQINTNSVSLFILNPLSILQQPQSVTNCQNDNALLSVTAAGSGISYQWKKNGADITGANNDTLFFNNATTGDSGNYVCMVSGLCGGPLLSEPAHLLIRPNVAITQSPLNITKCLGNDHIFNVAAIGFDMGYQWKKDGTDMPGRISDTLMLNNLSFADTGYYSCAINATCGTPQLTTSARLSISNTTGSIQGLNALYCTNYSPSNLIGIPAGGTFSGPGVNGNSFDPLTAGPGTHQIVYNFVDSYSCPGLVSSTVTVNLCTGVEDINDNGKIDIYPNPVNDEFIIAIKGGLETIHFEIYNSVGQIVFKSSLQDKTVVLTDSYSPGVYYIKFKSDRTLIYKRFIKN